jgi:hypothetical protein
VQPAHEELVAVRSRKDARSTQLAALAVTDRTVKGERGVIELISAIGRYGTVSMYLNVDRYGPRGNELL